MARPHSRRREAVAAQQRRSNPNPKPAGPPPIRHKARQKAIHNARHGRGGKPSRNQRSGNGNGNGAEEDYISLSSTGNNFNVLNGRGSRSNPIALDEEDSFEDGELMSDSGSDEEEVDDLDMYDAEDMMINVQVPMPSVYKGKAGRAEVMFPVFEAVRIYTRLYEAGFPLIRRRVDRYGLYEEDLVPSISHTRQPYHHGASQHPRAPLESNMVVDRRNTYHDNPSTQSSSHASHASSAASRQPSASTSTSHASAGAQDSRNSARNYTFDWGAHKGAHFTQVSENYLRTIGGNPDTVDRHPGLKEAFDYHRPGMRRTVSTPQQQQQQQQTRQKQTSVQIPTQQPARENAPESARQPAREPTRPPLRDVPRGPRRDGQNKPRANWRDFTFPKGAHMGKRLDQVPENYLRTLEGMRHVMRTWTGLEVALQDYQARPHG
jgi:hypothetical protein